MPVLTVRAPHGSADDSAAFTESDVAVVENASRLPSGARTAPPDVATPVLSPSSPPEVVGKPVSARSFACLVGGAVAIGAALAIGLIAGLLATAEDPSSSSAPDAVCRPPLSYPLPPLPASTTPSFFTVSAPPAGYGAVCDVALYAGDVSDTTAVLSVIVLDPIGCNVGGGGGAAVTSGSLLVQPLPLPSTALAPVPFSLSAETPSGADFRTSPGGYAAVVKVTGLTPGASYSFSASFPHALGSPNAPTHASRVGRFKTFRGAAYNGSISFLHLSCANRPPFPVARGLAYEVNAAQPDLASPGGPVALSVAGGGSCAASPYTLSPVAFTIFNGDTIYADRFWLPSSNPARNPVATPAFYRSLYKDQRNSSYTGAGFPFALASAATFTGWDDHEVINGYSGDGSASGANASVIVESSTFGLGGGGGVPGSDVIPSAQAQALLLSGYQAFFEAVPLPSAADLASSDPVPAANASSLLRPSRRLFRSYRPSQHVQVFHLDLRQYRDRVAYTASPVPVLPTGVPLARLQSEFLFVGNFLTEPDPVRDLPPMRAENRSLLGAAQRAWLRAGLLASTAKWKVIVSEFQILSWRVAPHDRWEGYGAERAALLSFIEDNRIEGVVFLTGDVHAAIYGRVNPGRSPAVWEFTTGPVGGSALGSGAALSGFAPVVDDLGRFLNVYASDAHIHGDGVRFAGLDTPNYMRVDADAQRFTVTARDGAGAVITDRFGRTGTFTLPDDDLSKKGYRGLPAGSGRRLRRAEGEDGAEGEEEAMDKAPTYTHAETREARKAVAKLVEGFAATGKLRLGHGGAE
jgi:alkaline phosphatase D